MRWFVEDIAADDPRGFDEEGSCPMCGVFLALLLSGVVYGGLILWWVL